MIFLLVRFFMWVHWRWSSCLTVKVNRNHRWLGRDDVFLYDFNSSDERKRRNHKIVFFKFFTAADAAAFSSDKLMEGNRFKQALRFFRVWFACWWNQNENEIWNEIMFFARRLPHERNFSSKKRSCNEFINATDLSARIAKSGVDEASRYFLSKTNFILVCKYLKIKKQPRKVIIIKSEIINT